MSSPSADNDESKMKSTIAKATPASKEATTTTTTESVMVSATASDETASPTVMAEEAAARQPSAKKKSTSSSRKKKPSPKAKLLQQQKQPPSSSTASVLESLGSDSVSSSRDKKPPPTVSNEKAASNKPAANKAGTTTSKKSAPKNKKTYADMIQEAIIELKGNRTNGSSLIAITRYLVEHYGADSASPTRNLKMTMDDNTTKSRIATAIKHGLSINRFVKVKASYKLNMDWVRQNQSQQKRREQIKAKRAAATKRNKAFAERQQAELGALESKKDTMSTEDYEAKKKSILAKKPPPERKRGTSPTPSSSKNNNANGNSGANGKDNDAMDEDDDEGQAKESPPQSKTSEAWKKKRAQKLRKRRYPMDDDVLHQEDKEWNIKAPEQVKKRPPLPYIWTSLNRHLLNKGFAVTPSKCDWLEYESRGIIPDLLQVYHFFSGDISYQLDPSVIADGSDGNEKSPTTTIRLVPAQLTLQHLMHAVDEILSGNARKCRMVPPLISHMFVTCLQLILQSPPPCLSSITSDTFNSGISEGSLERQMKQRRADWKALASGLSPASWADVCCLYMDAMERYSTTQASMDPAVVAPGYTDVSFLMRATDTFEEPPRLKETQKKEENSEAKNTIDKDSSTMPLPHGYNAYLGHPQSVLAKGHVKLLRSDPWALTAEEILALLRALTDDVLACRSDLAEALHQKNDVMQDLTRTKRLADSDFRKVRLAYEGPKKLQHKLKATRQAADEAGDSKPESEADKKAKAWKPTATKEEYDKALAAQTRADEAFEEGLRSSIARTMPIGSDRYRHLYYYFTNNPSQILVEQQRSPSGTASHLPMELQTKRTSWHMIPDRVLLKQWLASMDVRGRRENDLYETLTETRPHIAAGLHDCDREASVKSDRIELRNELKKQQEDLQLKLLQEEEGGGRRSGRFQSAEEIELSELRSRIAVLDDEIARDGQPSTMDFFELTGVNLLYDFDTAPNSIGGSGGNGATTRQTRRVGSRKRKERSSAADAQTNEEDENSKKEAMELIWMPCSLLWPTGDADGTGVVGIIVEELQKVEKMCHSMSVQKRDHSARKRWSNHLEQLVMAWCVTSPPVAGPDDSSVLLSPRKGATPSPSKKTPSTAAKGTGKKRRRTESPVSYAPSTPSTTNATTSHVVSAIRQPLLELEARIYELCGLATAERDMNEADDNLSTASADAAHEQAEAERTQELAWKKYIFRMTKLPPKKHTKVRLLLEDAMKAARRAQLPKIVSRLRSALLLHHPNSAGECKAAAIAVLEDEGGYDGGDLSDTEDDSEDDEAREGDDKNEEQEEVPSLLSSEAMMITGSLQGSDFANRLDWIQAVKDAKTLSRMGALVTAFARNAMSQLEKIKRERDLLVKSLDGWLKEEARSKKRSKSKARSKTPPPPGSAKPGEPTEVWADVEFTDEFCMVKLEGSPWWPAKKCIARDEQLKGQLVSVHRQLISIVGEEGSLRVVHDVHVRPFKEDAKLNSEKRLQAKEAEETKTGGKKAEDKEESKEDSDKEASENEKSSFDVEDEEISGGVSVSKEVRSQWEECMAIARRIMRGRRKGK